MRVEALNWERQLGWLSLSIIGCILATLVWIGAAWPHDFYSQHCCSGTDCAPAPLGSVTWTKDGWLVATPRINTLVPFDDERIEFNPPGEPQIHICEYPQFTLRCLYVPESQG